MGFWFFSLEKLVIIYRLWQFQPFHRILYSARVIQIRWIENEYFVVIDCNYFCWQNHSIGDTKTSSERFICETLYQSREALLSMWYHCIEMIENKSVDCTTSSQLKDSLHTYTDTHNSHLSHTKKMFWNVPGYLIYDIRSISDH